MRSEGSPEHRSCPMHGRRAPQMAAGEFRRQLADTQLGELAGGQYLSHLLNEIIEEVSRLFYLLLLPQDLFRLSQNFPPLKSYPVALLIEEAVVAVLHELGLHEFPPIVDTVAVEAMQGGPKDKPVDIG